MKYLPSLLLIIFALNIYSQGTYSEENNRPIPSVIHVSDWSDPMTFNTRVEGPALKGYGALSDSLSNTFGGITFYENDGKYYKINSWADYYYWFTKRFWFRFSLPVDVYENFYIQNNNAGMIWFLTGKFQFEEKFKNEPSLKELMQSDNKDVLLALNNVKISKKDMGVIEAEEAKYYKLISKNPSHFETSEYNNSYSSSSSSSYVSKTNKQSGKIKSREKFVKSDVILPKEEKRRRNN